MIDAKEPLYFKELDGNTLFSVVYAWLYEDDAGIQSIRNALGTWLWEDVQSVQTMDAESFPELEEPRCCIYVGGGQIHVRAEYQVVLRSWRKYRLRYKNRFQFTTPN